MKNYFCKMFGHDYRVTTEPGQNERMSWANTIFCCERCGHCLIQQEIKTVIFDVVSETESGIVTTLPTVK